MLASLTSTADIAIFAGSHSPDARPEAGGATCLVPVWMQTQQSSRPEGLRSMLLLNLASEMVTQPLICRSSADGRDLFVNIPSRSRDVLEPVRKKEEKLGNVARGATNERLQQNQVTASHLGCALALQSATTRRGMWTSLCPWPAEDMSPRPCRKEASHASTLCARNRTPPPCSDEPWTVRITETAYSAEANRP